MATKTISIELDVYLRLKRLRSSPSESFSKVLRRTLPVEQGVTAQELLAMIENGTYPLVGWTDLDIEAMEEVDSVPEIEDADCA